MEAFINRDIRALTLFLAAWIPVCAAVFLWASSFFSAWDGRAAAYRLPKGDSPTTATVLIVDKDGQDSQHVWPWRAVDGLDLPRDPLLIPPRDLEGRPTTVKEPFTLSFSVTQAPLGEGHTPSTKAYATTSPSALVMAIIAFTFGFGVRNMIWSGSPVSITRREFTLPKGQAAHGQPASTGSSGGNKPNGPGPNAKRRSKKGPPPGKRRGRRR